MKKLFSVIPLVLTLAGALALSACGSGGDNDASSGGSSDSQNQEIAAPAPLTIGSDLRPLSLNPAKNAWESVTINSIAYESLIQWEGEELKPALATSWEYVGRGHKVFRVTLRRDARFSDGTPVNAAAVKRWIEYFPTAAGPQSTLFRIASIETPDDWTVVLKLAAPTPDMASNLSSFNNWGSIASPAAVAKPAQLDTKTFGAGMYVLDPSQTVTGNQYTYVPNEYYYDQSKIRFSKVVLKVITSPATMIRAMRTGQLDVAAGNVTTGESAESAGLKIVNVPSLTAAVLFLDRSGVTSKPLGDVRVRQALNYAVDREVIANAIAGRFAQPTSQHMQQDLGLDPEYSKYYDYDPEKAKELLREAGYPDGFTLPLLTTTDWGPFGEQTSQAVAKYLEDVGVKVELVNKNGTDWASTAFGPRGPPAAQWQAGSATALNYGYLWARGGLLNKNGASDPVMTEAYEKAQVADDPTPHWREIANRSVTQATALPIFVFDSLWYAKDDIEGLTLSRRNNGRPLIDGIYRTK